MVPPPRCGIAADRVGRDRLAGHFERAPERHADRTAQLLRFESVEWILARHLGGGNGHRISTVAHLRALRLSAAPGASSPVIRPVSCGHLRFATSCSRRAPRRRDEPIRTLIRCPPTALATSDFSTRVFTRPKSASLQEFLIPWTAQDRTRSIGIARIGPALRFRR
jgi:hypothetical protein